MLDAWIFTAQIAQSSLRASGRSGKESAAHQWIDGATTTTS
jgi:hypothetical protein